MAAAALTMAVTAGLVLLLYARRRRRAALQGISKDVDWEQIQEEAIDPCAAQAVLRKSSQHGPLRLVKSESRLPWQPLVADAERRSFAYVARASQSNHFSPEMLHTWFEALRPCNFASDGTAWTDAYYRGAQLLRSTAWAVLDPACRCEYGYSDTWQTCVTDARMLRIIREISDIVAGACGLSTCLTDANGRGVINSVNLNWYPRGGGVGWHADDEFLFDSLGRDCTIVSLSLCSAPGEGRRRFQVRLRKAFRGDVDGEPADTAPYDASVVLGHGDLMTMEGLFQLYYLHSVWPGDSREHADHPLAQGERINLTWRTIVQHLDGGEECHGLRCPLCTVDTG